MKGDSEYISHFQAVHNKNNRHSQFSLGQSSVFQRKRLSNNFYKRGSNGTNNLIASSTAVPNHSISIITMRSLFGVTLLSLQGARGQLIMYFFVVIRLSDLWGIIWEPIVPIMS